MVLDNTFFVLQILFYVII